MRKFIDRLWNGYTIFPQSSTEKAPENPVCTHFQFQEQEIFKFHKNKLRIVFQYRMKLIFHFKNSPFAFYFFLKKSKETTSCQINFLFNLAAFFICWEYTAKWIYKMNFHIPRILLYFIYFRYLLSSLFSTIYVDELNFTFPLMGGFD